MENSHCLEDGVEEEVEEIMEDEEEIMEEARKYGNR